MMKGKHSKFQLMVHTKVVRALLTRAEEKAYDRGILFRGTMLAYKRFPQTLKAMIGGVPSTPVQYFKYI